LVLSIVRLGVGDSSVMFCGIGRVEVCIGLVVGFLR